MLLTICPCLRQWIVYINGLSEVFLCGGAWYMCILINILFYYFRWVIEAMKCLFRYQLFISIVFIFVLTKYFFKFKHEIILQPAEFPQRPTDKKALERAPPPTRTPAQPLTSIRITKVLENSNNLATRAANNGPTPLNLSTSPIDYNFRDSLTPNYHYL